jgi:hypothetical protein
VNVLPKSHRRLEPLEEPWRNHGGTMEEPLEMDTLPGIPMEFEDDFLLNFF